MMDWLAPLDIGIVMGLIFAWAVLALALAFRLFNFPDLTVEGSLPLGAAVFATMLQGGWGAPAAITAAVAAGAAAGALTGFLHVRFNINKFLAGIIVVAITYSLSLRVMNAPNIGLLRLPSLFDVAAPLNNAGWGTFHLGTVLLLSLLLLGGTVSIALGITSRSGMRLRVAGSNPEYARSLGISVPINLTVGLAITNGLAAVSGVLLATHQGFSDVGMGQGVLILALAAMTVGERILPERSLPYHTFVVAAAVVGSVAYQVLVAYAVRAGLAPTDLKLATAVLVLMVVALRFTKHGETFAEGLR